MVKRLVLACIIALAMGACATSPGEKPQTEPSGPQSRTAEYREYREIYSLYSKSEYETAIKKMGSFERRHTSSPLLPQVQNLHGLSFLLTKRPLQAIHYFKRAIASNPSSSSDNSFTQHVLYNLATSQFEADEIPEAMETATSIHADALERENQIKLHYLRSRIFETEKMPKEAAREALDASRLFSGLQIDEARSTRGTFVNLLEQALHDITSPSQVEDLYKSYEDSPLADILLFRMASLEIAADDRAKADTHLQTLITRYPESSYYSQAKILLSSPQAENVPVDATAVGVLLPMKGKFAKFGARSLQAIELAFHIFNVTEPDTKATLIIEDSGDDVDQAVRAFDKLVNKHHVVAVIGPLLSKGVEQVSARAQQMGVPLISLARHEGAPGDYLFQAGLTLRLQTSEVARYAVEKMGLKKFAILTPRDKTGEEASQYFWDAADTLGAQIMGDETYAPDETDFRQPVDKLSGLYYTESRQRELEALAKERELNHVRKRTRRTEQFYSLKPMVDYQAVFIPEDPKVTGQILPTFAYRDVDNVKFLGTSAWNSPDFPTRAQNYAENSIFVDAFFPESHEPGVTKFVQKYKNTFGVDPTDIDAIAYDAARLLQYAMSKDPTKLDRAEIKDRLKAIRDFAGVTGKISYVDGQFSRNLKILTVKSGKIVELDNFR